MISRIRYSLLIALAGICHLRTFSQTYPVQTFVQVSPPHTSYLPDYADPFSNQMKIFLTLTDFSVPSYQIKLRFKLEGNGYTITTSSLLNLPVTTLSPGTPVEISGSDLAPYLSSQNLIFTGIDVAEYELRKILPEGPCQICVEVIDYSNPNLPVLSNQACTPVWFSLNDPPLLNTPFCGTQVTSTDPQGMIFSWTPLHMNSLHSAGTQYVFELFEIRPNGADPNQVVNNSLPIFMQVTDQTYINFGITEPQLQTGMSYVWRVRAQDIQGRDFFRNNGYSSVCTFTYGNVASSLADDIVLNLNSNGTGTRMGLAWWNTSSTFTHYKVEVRKTGNPDYTWFPLEAQGGELKIYQLEPATQYECRVKGLIGDEYESAWSNTSVFTTQPLPDYACGNTTLPPRQQQIDPLLNAIPGMTFQVGQFEMHVTSIEAINPVLQPGHYRGTGKIAVGFTFTNIRVRFENILVDENLDVHSGKVEAITEGIDAWVNDLTSQPDYYVDGTITDFEWNDSTSLTVWVDGVPQTFQFPDDGTLIIQDEEGMVYTFNSDGTWSVNSNLIYSEDVLTGNANYRVNFSADVNQHFGFDEKKYTAWIHDYEVIRLSDSTNYFVPFKSIAPGETDYVMATVKSPNVLSAVSFEAVVNGQSMPVSAQSQTDSTYRLTLSTLDESCFVYAIHSGQRIGKLWVKVLPEIQKEIVIVPVNGASLTGDAIENQLNEIYAQANVSFSVSQAPNYVSTSWDMNNDGLLQQGDVSLMSHYSEEMRLLRDQYLEANPDHDADAYYLFIVPGFQQNDLNGYMVRGKAIGFLKQETDGITAAHELAHGIFSLEHTFPEIQQGTTDNLMDYSGQVHLSQKQWYYIHQPLPAFSMFDDEEEGQSMTFNTNDYSPIFQLKNPDGSITFLALSGDPITLKGTISKLSFVTYEDEWLYQGETVEGSYAPMGGLISFEVNGVYYTAKGQLQGAYFSGYYSETAQDWYHDTLSYNRSITPVIVTPTYSVLGFRGSAFHINQPGTSFVPVNGSKVEGTVQSRWAFLEYVTKDSILSGVDVNPMYSQQISFETQTVLSDILFSNTLNPLNPYDDTYDLFEYEFFVESDNPAGAGYLEKYIGYEALLIYQAAYLIEKIEAANDCYLHFEQLVSAGHRSGLFTEYYNALDQGQSSLPADAVFASDHAPMIFIPAGAPLALVGFSEPEREFKQRRLSELIGGLEYYNKLISSFNHNQEFSDLESAIAIRLVDRLSSEQYAQGLGDCLLKLLNPATKVKIMTRVFTSEWSDDKEELIVRVLENTTPAQFAVLYPAISTNECALLNESISDLWYSHFDRYMNTLSWHILLYQISLPAYNEDNLPVYNLYKDGLSPFDTETDYELDGCEVTLYYQPLGIDNPLGTTFNAWDLVRFNVQDDFDFPGYTGAKLSEGDVLVAPAIWAYYFLDEHGQHTNTEALTYFVGAALTIYTGGASAATAIELTALGASYVAHVMADEYPNDLDLQEFAVAVDWLTLGTIFTPAKLAEIGLNGVPWISATVQGSKRIFTFTTSEFSDFLKMIRTEYGVIDDVISHIQVMIDKLDLMQMVTGAKQQFLMYLLYVKLNLNIAKYGRVSQVSRLAVQANKVQLELYADFGTYTKGNIFEIGDYVDAPDGSFYMINPHLYNAALHGEVVENGVLLKIDNIPVSENGTIVQKSYEVVATSLNLVLVREVANLTNYTPQFSRDIIEGINGFSDNIQGLLSANAFNGVILSIGDFKQLIYRSTIDETSDGIPPLSGQEMAYVNLIRNAIPNPTPNTILQKAIPIGWKDSWFVVNTNNTPKSIGGYMTTSHDSKHLITFEQIYDGMRLDYDQSDFLNATECLVIRFKSNDVNKLNVPRNKNNGGVLNDPDISDSYNKNAYPFTGNGFTSGKNGNLGVPEWKADYGNNLIIEDGAEMFLITSDGQEVLVGVYNRDSKKFLEP